MKTTLAQKVVNFRTNRLSLILAINRFLIYFSQHQTIKKLIILSSPDTLLVPYFLPQQNRDLLFPARKLF